MARKGRGPQKDRRGGPRPGAGRKPALTEFQMFIVGGKCEKLWKAAAKRRAKERLEAKIDDPGELRTLHLSAKNIAHGTGSQRIGRILAASNERFEAFDCDDCSLGLYPTRLEARNAIKREPLDRIAHDIDAEMGKLGRYQSSRLKQPKGEYPRIVGEVVAWARERYGSAISARRVEASWDYYRRMERLGQFPPTD